MDPKAHPEFEAWLKNVRSRNIPLGKLMQRHGETLWRAEERITFWRRGCLLGWLVVALLLAASLIVELT